MHNLFNIKAQAPLARHAADHPPAAAEEARAGKKRKRTLGLKLFDIVLYPLFTNVGVWTVSVGATYLTTHGDKHLLFGLGPLMKRRGVGFKKGMSWVSDKTGWSSLKKEDSIEMWKTVAFSFIDGSLIAPFVKLLEDRREKIAKWIDAKLGTKPEDESVYEAEPKQGWRSVWLGRLATFLIVFPTAMALENKHLNEIKMELDENTGKLKPVMVRNKKTGEMEEEKKNLNDKLFRDPGIALGDWVNRKLPKLKDKFLKINFNDLFKIVLFEFFYTSVCTFGLYVNSRIAARFFNKRDKEKQELREKEQNSAATPETASQEKKPAEAQPEKDIPAEPSPGFAETLKRDLARGFQHSFAPQPALGF